MAAKRVILVPADGSDNSNRAVRFALDLLESDKAGALHLLNVQPPLGGAISAFVAKSDIQSYHREEGEKALKAGLALCKKANCDAAQHISVGRPGKVVADFARKLGATMIVMGTRGHTGLGGVLMGSVAQDVIAHAPVPVCLVK